MINDVQANFAEIALREVSMVKRGFKDSSHAYDYLTGMKEGIGLMNPSKEQVESVDKIILAVNEIFFGIDKDEEIESKSLLKKIAGQG